MNCTDINHHIDDYLDKQLSAETRAGFEQHVDECASCAQQLESAKVVLSGLSQLSVPEPSANFEQRVFAEVRRQHKQHHRIHFASGFATAVAASLLIWFASTIMLPTGVMEQPQSISLAMSGPQTVRLMFDSQKDIEQVKLSIGLPDNVELDGYPGQRELTWQTSLKKGQNILALPVMAVGHGQGELIAQLSYGNKIKTLRVVLKTSDDGVLHYQLEEVKSA